MATTLALAAVNSEVLAGMPSTYLVTVTNTDPSYAINVETIALYAIPGYVFGMIEVAGESEIAASGSKVFSVQGLIKQVPLPADGDSPVAALIDVRALVTTVNYQGVQANAYTNEVNMVVWPQYPTNQPEASLYHPGQLDFSSNLNSALLFHLM